MTGNSIYATRRLDPDDEDSGISEEEVAEGQTLIAPPPLPESEAVVTRPPLPDMGAEAPPPLPEPEVLLSLPDVDVEAPPLPEAEGVHITSPAMPEIVAEPQVLTFAGTSEPEAGGPSEIPSPFEEAEVLIEPAENAVVAPPSPVEVSSGGGTQVVLPSDRGSTKSSTGMIVLIVVVVLLLLCCCCFVAGALVLMVVPESSWDTMYLLRGVLPLL
ncbi:MAG: hypothetical protein MUF84_03425 [Anaerolineae bacterium]|jgi:hypothetical protein|nr:hypothetical protein [Anaerolineae bacterium]